MTAKTAFSTPSATEIRFERRFAADCDTIWANWTEAKHLQKWWGPDGWTTPVCEMDFRVGGSWFYCMQGPNDMKSSGRATFRAIDAPRSISYVDFFTDEKGAAIEGMPEAHTLIEFAESEGETKVTGTTRYASQAFRDQVIEMGVEVGIDQTMNSLDEYLAALA